MRLCALALCAFLFSGCALFSKDDGTEPLELVDFDSTAEVDILWRTGVGSGRDGGVVKLLPALDDERVYAADAKGLVMAVARDSGKRQWRRKTGDQITGGVSVNAGTVLYGTGNGEVVALSSDTGEESWRTTLSGEVISVPQTDGTIVAAQTMDGKLHALNAESGAKQWSYDSPPPVLTLRGTASPVIDGSSIIAGFASGKVMRFDKSNGLVEWEHRVALPEGRSEIERMVDVDASPVVQDGNVYAAAFQGKVASLSRSNGRPRWEQNASSHQDLAIVDRSLYLSEADGRLRAFSAATGSPQWENEQMLRRDLSGPQVLGDYVMVGDFDGYLHVMNREDGEFVARDRLDRKGLSNTMITDGEVLYVLGNSGRLIALEVISKD